MKTSKRNRMKLYSGNSNSRWQWMAGATAATAAGVTAPQAGAITINLVNNYISAPGGNHLNADLTGDGHPDLTIKGAFASTRPNNGYYYFFYLAGATLNGIQAYGYFSNDHVYGKMRLGSRSGFSYGHSYTTQLTGSIPIFFKDLNINRGAPTFGSLQVTVFPAYIRLDSFTYNTPAQVLTGAGATVPDQGSSLALLAIGAGGILAFRRWRRAQAGS
jgi:hypothetical protein